MRKKLSLHRKGMSPLPYLLIGVLILSGCVATSGTQVTSDDSLAPIIESIRVSPSTEQTVVEVVSSRPAHYTAFKLVDPPRVILDVRGVPGDKLPMATSVNAGNVKDILFEEGKTQTLTTRMVVGLAESLDFRAEAEDNLIRVTLMPKSPPAGAESARTDAGPGDQEKPFEPATPRIFVKPGPSKLNQVLGIDFVMLDHGKSRLIITTDKKIPYDLERREPKDLVLKLSTTSIPPQLMREIDSTHFQGAVDRIRPAFSPSDKEASVAVSLREMVPFHVKQSENEISIDFGKTSLQPPEKKIVPLQLAQAPAEAPAPEGPAPEAGAQALQIPRPPEVVGLLQKRYTGAPMTMDFVNADVTNILRLIGEVSNLNIVWGPEVQGNVSMRLKNVPWDQALDLILANNNLAKREAGNVVWITTKAQMAQVEAEERRKIQEYEDSVQKLEEKEKEKEVKEEPILTEYIGIDFATAEEIRAHLEGLLSDRGTISVDTRTNTIIIKDTASTIDEAKRLVKQFDTPVKQVMIEARIVDATDSFTRDLGIRWDKLQVQTRNTVSTEFTNWGGTPGTVDPADVDENTSDGSRLYSPTFTSNSPDNWTPNMGLVFSKLSGFGLTATILDAKLALAEVEGKSKTIAAPKVIASNGEEAKISRGDQIVIPATENVESTTLDATLSLTVTPNVSFNNYISLNVAVTDDSAPTTTRLQKKSVNTKLMVKSGETIVIGGIYTESSGEDENGIPGLRRIPLLGWLFKANRKTTSKTELLIFLTPTVIPSTL